MIALALLLLAALGLAVDPPLALKALLVLPGLLLAPGLGYARWLNRRQHSALQIALDGAWLSLVMAVPTVLLGARLGANPWALWGLSVAWALPGVWLGWNADPLPGLRPRVLAGLGALLVAVVLWTGLRADELLRPLDAWWWSQHTETLSETPVEWAEGQGFEVERIGWPEAGAAHLLDPELDGGTLEIQTAGEVMLLLRGPIGSLVQAGQAGQWAPAEKVAASVQVQAEEGEVRRYLERGVIALPMSVRPGTLDIKLEATGPVEIYLLPGQAAPWSLDEAGVVRFAHYYQLLNLVENQVWAQELLSGERLLTVNQPPLWSFVLAVASATLSADMPGAGLLFAWVLLLLGAQALRLVEQLSPRAPLPAWLLPPAMVLVHAELMLQPGSVNFPDSLYAAALVGALSAFAMPGGGAGRGRFVLLTLLAGLLRYPGVVAVVLGVALHHWFWPQGRLWPRLRDLGVAVLALAGVFGVVALLSGALGDWLFILWFETVPEHYDNNGEAAAIWARPPAFYWTWLRYTGFGLLAALPLASREGRWALGAAGLYSLLLCTIDHFPTHYFLPLLALSGVSIACNTSALPSKPLRWGLSGAAVLAALAFVVWGRP